MYSQAAFLLAVVVGGVAAHAHHNAMHTLAGVLYGIDSPNHPQFTSVIGAINRRLHVETATHVGVYVSPSLKQDLLIIPAVQNIVCGRILQRYLLNSKEANLVHRPIIVGTTTRTTKHNTPRLEVVGSRPLPIGVVDASMLELSSRCRALASRVVTEAGADIAPISAISHLIEHMSEMTHGERAPVLDFYSSVALIVLGPNDIGNDDDELLSRFHAELAGLSKKYHIPYIVVRLGKVNKRPVTNSEFTDALDWVSTFKNISSSAEDGMAKKIDALKYFGARMEAAARDDDTEEAAEAWFVDTGDLLVGAERLSMRLFGISTFRRSFGIVIDESYKPIVPSGGPEVNLYKDSAHIVEELVKKNGIQLQKINTIRCVTPEMFKVVPSGSRLWFSLNPVPFQVASMAFMDPLEDYCNGKFDTIKVESTRGGVDPYRASVNLARYITTESQIRLDGLVGTPMSYQDEEEGPTSAWKIFPGALDKHVLSPLRHATFTHLWRHGAFNTEYSNCIVTAWSPPTPCLNFRSFRFRRYMVGHSGPFPCDEELVDYSPCPMTSRTAERVRKMNAAVNNHYDMWTWVLTTLTAAVWLCFVILCTWAMKKMAFFSSSP